ncbi:hypothetical protein [Bacillus sp. HMF5848]|nr:hypothetical protein [Bacillus sp. HMF5848]
MKKFLVAFILIFIGAIITFNINNNQLTHQPVPFKKIEEVIVF